MSTSISTTEVQTLRETLANKEWLFQMAEYLDTERATFTRLITKKKGDWRGRGADRKKYADDEVEVCIVTGFRYDKMLSKSLALLPTVTDEMALAKARDDARAKKFGTMITLDDVATARVELMQSLNDSLNGTNNSTTDHVYEPLVLEGKTVRSVRVYKCVKGNPEHKCHCRDCTGEADAPKDGALYIQGVSVSTRVLTPATNGPLPLANSAAKTIAKDALESFLPRYRYASYPIERGAHYFLTSQKKDATGMEIAGVLATKEQFLERLAEVA